METKIKVIQSEIKSEQGTIKMVLTKEIVDRDGEMISVDGMDVTNFKNNPVMIDAHNMNGSIVDNVLGKVNNLKKSTDEKGIKQWVGEPEFAPTPKGQVAKMLVDGGYVKTVSVGFGVKDFDHTTGLITKSELYEVSLVAVPSNVGAMISKSLKGDETVETKLIKSLGNYENIKKKIKQYRALFMSDELWAERKMTKSGNELVDLKAIFDVLTKEITNEKEEQDSEKEKVENKEEQTDESQNEQNGQNDQNDQNDQEKTDGQTSEKTDEKEGSKETKDGTEVKADEQSEVITDPSVVQSMVADMVRSQLMAE
jgi:HK97 family phage prohead protease